MEVVPISLLRSRFSQRGRRLPKLKHLEREIHHYSHYSSPYSEHYGVYNLGDDSDVPAWASKGRESRSSKEVKLSGIPILESKGNLDENDYRYWIGNRYPGAQYSTCRRCMVLVHVEQRKEHSKKNDCNLLLVEVFKKLQFDKRCVQCDEVTLFSKWGIPLCDRFCIDDWKFELERSEAFLKALDLVNHLRS
jgi:hypothetical protein